MSVTSKTHLDPQVNVWINLTNLLIHRTLRELGGFHFSNFSSNRDQRINEVLSANQLLRRTSTSVENNCLLDTIFQQICIYISEPDFKDFVDFVREKIGQTKSEQLSINDEEQGVQILSAVQAYLFEKAGLQCHFDLTVLLADNEGEIGYVDMHPMTSILQSYGEVIPIRMIVVNYNHYEPIFEKGKESSASYEITSQNSSKQELEDQRFLKIVENHSSPPLVFLDPLSSEGYQGLRPIEENPLIEFKRLGFGLFCIDLSNFRQKYPEWSEALDRGHVSLRDGRGYLSNLEQFKSRLGIPEAEEGAGQNNEHLVKIEEAVHIILNELSKKQPDLQQLERCVHTIRDHAYELFIDPEKDVLAYIQAPFHIYINNQMKFREELRKITGEDSSREEIAERILDSMRQGKISEEKENLLKEYPSQKEIIFQLAEAAERLFLEAIKTAQKEIQDYQARPEVRTCYEWFLGFPHLLTKYQMLRQGKYVSLADIPRGPFHSEKIYYSSYTPRLSALIGACRNLQNGDLNQENFEKYLLPQRKYRHFQETLVPLSFFLEVINNIILWPKVYEPSEGEWEFLRGSIMFFMGIANKNFPGNIRIPYEYLSISDDKIKSEATLLRKKDVSTERKRIACRYLYHSRIPWKSLRTIGNLTHRSGGVSDQDAGAKDRLLRTAIVDFVRDLPQVREAIHALIDFELREFDSEPFIVQPEKSSPLYAGVNLLGNFEESRIHLKECLETLGHWDNLPLMVDDFSNPKIQCAILRTIQLQGEITKNIREIGVLGSDLIWGLFEEIRDILSHSERVQTEKRLKELLEIPENHPILMGIVNDFRNIREFLQTRFRLLNACRTWDERLHYLDSGAQLKICLDLPGLERFFIFLTNKISAEMQENLLRSLKSGQAISCRSEISLIVKQFLSQNFDLSNYKDLVKLLPLTTNQKKEVENGIKLLISPKAAENDARDAKYSMSKTSISIVNSLLQNKKGSYPKEELKILKGMLEEVKSSIGSEAFRDKVALAKSAFQSLKQIWKQKSSLPKDQLNVIEENLTNLTENVEEYIERKKERLLSILGTIPIDLSDPDVLSRGTLIIKDMQLRKISSNDLEIYLHEIGIKGDGKKLWVDAHQRCLGRKKIVPNEDSEQDEALELRQLQRLIEKIQNRIRRLDQLMIHQNSGSIMKDSLLLLACQYLISDFRSAASNLELSLESIKYTIAPWNLEFIQDIQRDLLFFMERGNDILHAHDISEPGTMTPHGLKFFTQQNVGTLIYNFSAGRNRDVLIESLFSKLEKLKEFCRT